MLDWSRVEIISFDCYGTLVDWERGILSAVGKVAARHGIVPDPEHLLAAYARLEADAEGNEGHLSYREVLRRVMRRMGPELGMTLTEREADALVRSLPEWPLFADTRDALLRLQRRYRLAVLSNVDDDLFAETQRRLGVDLDLVVTAEQVGSYKPDSRNFQALLSRACVPSQRLLHAAQSRYHDIAPASRLGLATVWVNRGGGADGGATLPVAARPDLEVPDLKTLADLACSRDR